MFSPTIRKWFFVLLLVAIVSFSSGYLLCRYRRRPMVNPQPAAIHLNRYYHFTELMRDPAIEGQLLRYRSAHDLSMQTMFIMQPAGHKSERLFFFFHGMDGDRGDGVVVRELVTKLNGTVISLGGRGPSWVSDALISDAEQVIRTRVKDFPGYYLVGISMGGTQVLALPALLPEDLRRSMLGVVSLIPGADLVAIASRSSNDEVRRTLQASVNGNMALLEQRSPRQLLNQYKADLPFVILYEQQDTILLTGELEKFITALRSNRHPVTTFATPGEHSFSFSNLDYQEFIKELGSNLTQNSVPVLPN